MQKSLKNSCCTVCASSSPPSLVTALTTQFADSPFELPPLLLPTNLKSRFRIASLAVQLSAPRPTWYQCR